MRAVVQRVTQAAVSVDGRTVAAIGAGLVVLLGVGRGDAEKDADELADKVAHLRVFPDDAGRMNRSVHEASGSVLVVPQFTLYGDCRKGRRPSYVDAAPPEDALPLFRHFTARVRALGLQVAEGVFQASMDVSLVNQGPVTLLLDSRRLF
jgi:D-tyrosyl-tRNA(Tyr) deacylase